MVDSGGNGILQARGVSKSFRGRSVVDEVSFEVKTGEVVGLLGPNGAGKTTSFYMVVGLLYPQTGGIYLDHKEITSQPIHIRSRQGISYLPQNVSIFRKLTVEENLLAIMEVIRLPKEKRLPLLDEMMEKMQIKHIAKSLGIALSGGERRRVEIARALIIRPRFLLLDEPFAGVDPLTVHEIQLIIEGLRQDGLGILITDHNVRETLGSCNRSYVLSSGKIIAHGTPEEIYENPVVREAYLGESFSR